MDGLLGIAAIAAGLALVGPGQGAVAEIFCYKLLDKCWPDGTYTYYITREGTLAEVGARILAPCSAALLLSALRQPRPGRRRLLDGPGFVATATATSFMAFRLAGGLAEHLAIGWGPKSSDLLNEVTNAAAVGPAVMASWILLAACGRRRVEPTWVDRLGQLAGIGWILMAVSDWLAWPVR
ncbi:MAG: hypothetical protein U0800_02120 [Isosphaeraceae bacterium]